MEPVKFEKHIKEQLQRREIKPSADSWEKLQEKLEQKQPASKRPVLWLGLAAAFAGIFFLLGTFFSNPFIENQPAVVEQSSEVPVNPKNESFEPVPAPAAETFIASEEVEEPEVFQSRKISENKGNKGNRENHVSVIAEQRQQPVPELEEEGKLNLALVKESLLQQYPEVLAKVSDTEIEALLLLAEAEMEPEPTFASQNFSADALLNEVEYELEQSFRDKVFEVIMSGFSKAKTAVANRNF